MTDPAAGQSTKPPGFVVLLITGWALAGGALLLAVVLMTVTSIVTSALFGRPLPGDVELTQMGVAIAAFSFLPYCQMTDAHVTADIFTTRASRRTLRVLMTVSALTGLAIAAVLVWRMWHGLFDYITYSETTAVLGIPHWWAFVPILISLALTVVAAIHSLATADARARIE